MHDEGEEGRHPFVGAWAFLSPHLARSLKWLPNKSLGIFFFLVRCFFEIGKTALSFVKPKRRLKSFHGQGTWSIQELAEGPPSACRIITAQMGATVPCYAARAQQSACRWEKQERPRLHMGQPPRNNVLPRTRQKGGTLRAGISWQKGLVWTVCLWFDGPALVTLENGGSFLHSFQA